MCTCTACRISTCVHVLPVGYLHVYMYCLYYMYTVLPKREGRGYAQLDMLIGMLINLSMHGRSQLQKFGRAN